MRAKELIDRPREAAGDRLAGPRRVLKVAVAAVTGIYRTGRGVGRWSERRSRLTARPPSAAAAGGAFVVGLAVGAAGAYLFDPADGKRRRHVARDRLAALGRRGVREAKRKSRYARGIAEGAVAEATGGDGRPAEELNDPALARKVESEIFRDPDAPKDRVDVNVADRVVYLRGTLEDPDRAAALARAAASVEGVERVENLIATSPATGETKDMAAEGRAQ
jgi:BON domain